MLSPIAAGDGAWMLPVRSSLDESAKQTLHFCCFCKDLAAAFRRGLKYHQAFSLAPRLL
jgi:hypothetical protein